MGLGTRIFVVDDDDTLKRMPLKRFHRLFRRDPEEKFVEYAGKRIRYVLVVLDLKNRKPVEILKIQYSYLAFDSQGRLREDDREKAARLSLDMLKPMPSEQDSNDVINARHKFATKLFNREFRWKPSPEIETAIFNAILS